MEGDRDRLAQVVANLLTNAAKYTPDGGAIRVRAFGRGGHVVIDVVDDGVGLSQDDQRRVFEAFERVANGQHRSENGLGLGLAIVRSLVTLHGGQVACHSEGAGSGSTFTVELPRVDGEIDPQPEASGAAG